MDRIRVDVRADHLERISRRQDPVGAVVEMVWNALDADAVHVDIDLELNPLGGVEKVTVRDDGSGMPTASFRSYFKNLGGSWKATAKFSSAGRTLHGKVAKAASDGQRWVNALLGILLRSQWAGGSGRSYVPVP